MVKNKIVLISTFPDIQAYGIRMVSSILKNAGYKTNLIFLNAPFGELYSEDILQQVSDISRDSLFVGISLMTNFFERARQVTAHLKKHLKIPVVWGGIHTAVKPDECLKYADIVCIGEAEKVIVPFAQKLAVSHQPLQMDNFWFNMEGKTIKNRIEPFIERIDGLPFPDYEYVNHYVIDQKRLMPLDLKRMEEYMGYEYSTIATRGCFYNCTFCANNFFEKNFNVPGSMRLRSNRMQDLVGELAWIKKHLGFIRIFKFADDLFMALPKETLEEFCSLYKASGLNLPMDITGIHPLILKEDKFKLMVDAGLKYVRMGIQTGSQNTRSLYGRKETEDKILEGAGIIHKYRDHLKAIRYDFMVDNPWESPQDIKDSLMLLARLPKPYRINLFSLTLYPGTELYNKAKQEGIMSDEKSQIYSKHYHDNVNTSYYNRLFKIIPAYRLPKKCFNFLINRESSLTAKILSFLLLKGVDTVTRLARIRYLISEGVRDVASGNFERINKFIFIRPKVVH